MELINGSFMMGLLSTNIQIIIRIKYLYNKLGTYKKMYVLL